VTRQARSAGCRRHRVRQVLLLCMAPARMRAAARRVATMAEQGGVWLGHFSAASYLHLASLRVPASGCPQHTLCGSRASIGAPRERTSTFFHVCTHLPRAAQGDGVQLHTVSSSLFSFVNLIPERTGCRGGRARGWRRCPEWGFNLRHDQGACGGLQKGAFSAAHNVRPTGAHDVMRTSVWSKRWSPTWNCNLVAYVLFAACVLFPCHARSAVCCVRMVFQGLCDCPCCVAIMCWRWCMI
jgi:hypothetical protein